MLLTDVLAVTTTLHGAPIPHRVSGGCGADALVGHQTRPLSAARQRVFHAGYTPRSVDVHDLALLAGLADVQPGGRRTPVPRFAG